jgi:hypothetical protein
MNNQPRARRERKFDDKGRCPQSADGLCSRRPEPRHEWIPNPNVYDIGDEVKAWKAQQNTSINSDYWKTVHGKKTPSLLNEFSNSETDSERARVLARRSYPNRNPRQNSDFVYSGDDGKPGQLIRTDTTFGRINRIVEPRK